MSPTKCVDKSIIDQKFIQFKVSYNSLEMMICHRLEMNLEEH